MTIRDLVGWLELLVVLAPVIGALGWQIYEFRYRPYRIPSAEIERLADEVIARNPDDPAYAAFLEEEAAWYRSDIFEQGRWRRVRRLLWRRVK